MQPFKHEPNADQQPSLQLVAECANSGESSHVPTSQTQPATGAWLHPVAGVHPSVVHAL